MLAQEPVEGDGVGAGLESHTVVWPELLCKGADGFNPGRESVTLEGALLEHGDLGGVLAHIEAKHTTHGSSPLRRWKGGHDNYPFELEAQPGESKGQPVRITDSRSIRQSACPHRVIAKPAVRPIPGGQSLREIEAPTTLSFHTG
jgi:hypothetical protein